MARLWHSPLMVLPITSPSELSASLNEHEVLAALVPDGLPPSDPLRERYDDRSVGVAHGSGMVWLEVWTQDRNTLVAQAVFGADDSVVRCDTVDVMDAYKRQGIATALYEIAADIFGAVVVPSDLRSDEARAFWGGRASIASSRPGFTREP